MAVLKLGELSFLRDLADLDPETLQDPDAVDAEIEVARRGVEQEMSTPPGEQGTTDLAGPETPSPMAPTRFGPPAGGGSLTALFGVINMVRSHPRNRLRAPGAQVNVLVTTDGRVVVPERFGAETAELLGSVLNGEACLHLLDREGLHIQLGRSARTVSSARRRHCWRGGTTGAPCPGATIPDSWSSPTSWSGAGAGPQAWTT